MQAILGKMTVTADKVYLQIPYKVINGVDRDQIASKPYNPDIKYLILDENTPDIVLMPRNTATAVKPPIVPDSWRETLVKTWESK